jgi:dephospho-CoA kinase
MVGPQWGPTIPSLSRWRRYPGVWGHPGSARRPAVSGMARIAEEATASIASVYLIGLTGGIASGKTVVAKRLEQLGATIVDADQLARDVVAAGTPGLAAIADRFGPGVIAADGTLDRPALGAVIFRDPDARHALNAITHPGIRELSSRLFADADKRDPDAVVVYDVPLLVEALRDPNYHEFDLIVVVSATADTRLDRLVTLRGLSRVEAQHRLASQATETARLAIADVVIDSDGSLEETLVQADALWESLTNHRSSDSVRP